ncbi:MAG: DUF3078 domain-containing protein [Alphaproteobacteria bacterium]|nr:DUF3078 domain-containing protein [Alphaproteobacteria bacterium]
MKKLISFLGAVALPFCAVAAEEDLANKELILNIRRIGLDLSKTKIKNAKEYSNSPISALNTDDQEFIKGVFDTALEYTHNRFNWDNSVFAEYGKTTVKPYDGPRTTNENADKILLSSNLSYACWDYTAFKLGPMVRASYETEFEPANHTADRLKVARAFGGFSLFDAKIVKTLYLAGVYEYDFTDSSHRISKSAAELGWRLEYDVREGVRLSTDGYYREYLSYSEYVGTDLKRDLSLMARMDTNLWGDFTMGPYVQYRLAKARGEDVYGGNLTLGVSFNYITKFGLR